MEDMATSIEQIGISSTGTKHGLSVDAFAETAQLRFCVTGVGGKRHATVFLSQAQANELAHFIEEASIAAHAHRRNADA
jgi:hypothetical protein